MLTILLPMARSQPAGSGAARNYSDEKAQKVVEKRYAERYNVNISRGVMFGEILKKGEDAMLFSPAEKGQGLVEYALILVLVAIVVIAALMVLGPVIGNTFSTINNSLNHI
jgi:pilus assembly protein Flp/PilA